MGIHPPSFSDVERAAERLRGHVVRTPLLYSSQLNALAGRQVVIKPECLQHTGSFKFRGAFNRLCQLTAKERAAGVVAWSSGNHAQGVALAAQLLNIPARIVMPADAPQIKTRNTLALGAEVVAYDRYSEDREVIARDLVMRDGGTIVPSYDDADIIAGQGTVGLELLQDAEPPEALLVCCSGGGLVAGCALAVEGLNADTAVFSVEPAEFNDHERSLRNGIRERVEPGSTSICDALLAATPGELTFAINQQILAGGLSVSDEEVLLAMGFAFEHLKLVLEPGGAVALAALLSGKVPEHYRSVGIILSGGNVDPAVFAAAIKAVSNSQSNP
ncbi:MAG: threonine/serine dehydratase [Halieaceae bacterium]|jgi:threonine dehydratase|nr:threonine/serine dehydratase [Halieaceae bacterium]